MVFGPIEIISHIFSIGADSDSASPYPDHSQPRHIKPYIGLVTQICRRWNTITRWEANSHFWVTSLYLRLISSSGGGDMFQYNHYVRTVTKFRHALSTAGDSDITLFWSHRGAKGMPPNDRTTWSRIFMHCVAILSEYCRQLTQVDLRYLNDYEHSFAKACLSGLESPWRLQTLYIDTCGATSSAETSTHSSNFDEALLFYDIGYNDPTLCLGSSCPSLSTIAFYDTASPDLNIFAATLRYITLWGVIQTLNPFRDKPHYFLETLRLGEEAIDTAMTWDAINLPYLHTLSLMWRNTQTILSLLSHISVPRLESLDLEPRGDDETSTHDTPNILKAQPPVYRRLTKLKLREYMHDQLPLIFQPVNSLIDNSAPVLEQLHLSLPYYYENGPDEPGNSQAMSIRTPQKVVLEPEGSQTNLDNVLSCLGDGTGMEELTIRDMYDVYTYNPSQNVFVFPDLKNLVLHGKHLHHLADHINGPLLTSLQLKEWSHA